MWAWGLDQHVRFWSRRQLHETLVHRMDLELAAQIEPTAEPVITIDAIDEYLSNIEKVARHSSDLSQLRGDGERLALRIRDTDELWVLTLDKDGFSVSKDEGAFTTEIVGPPLDLLLLILGRRTVDESDVGVFGERRLIDFWLSHSAFD
jgi:predicted lipid carrier protein YhbT